MEVSGESLGRSYQYLLSSCRIEPQLGRSERVIKCPDDAVLETRDFNRVAQLEEAYGVNQPLRAVHLLESAWKFVGLSALGVVAASVLFFMYGIPWLAKEAAHATPVRYTEGVSENTLGLLEDYLRPSQLPAERQAELQAAFARLTTSLGKSADYRLELRGGEQLGANALALPSGIIIMTDELVALAETDLELEAVLAHEIGHVELRHGMQGVYQSAGVFFLVSVLLGDVTSATGTLAALPAALVENGYSRGAEREADAFAGRYLLETEGSAAALGDILSALSRSHGGELPSFLSTHPNTEKRLEQLEQLER